MKTISNILNIQYILITFLSAICWLNLDGQQVEVIGDFKAPLVWADGTVQTNTIINDGFEDMTLSPFTTSGDSDWTVDNLDAFLGEYSAVSGPTLSGESSSMHLVVIVPEFHIANLSFATKSTVISGDNLFYVNNSFEFNVTSTGVWTTFEKELPSGTHNLEWRFEASSFVPLSQQLRLDNVLVTYLGDHVVRIQDGNQALGKILTSDQDGNATWGNHPTLIHPNVEDDNGLKIIYPDDPSDPNCIYDPSMASGDGVFVMNALNRGFESRCADNSSFYSSYAGSYGFYSKASNSAGFYTIDAGDFGFFAQNASINGFRSNYSMLDGFYSYYAGTYGFYSNNSTKTGFFSSNDGDYGFYAQNAGKNGFRSNSSMFEGFYTTNAGTYGFYSSNSTDIGFYSLNDGDHGFYAYTPGQNSFHSDLAGINGFYSNTATNTGFLSDDSGFIGFRSNNAGTDGFVSWYDNAYGFISQSAGLDGVYSVSNAGDEGYFSGTVVVTGNLSKGGGSFKIDHPLDPENKFLYHSFVESPDMMNVYNGNIVTDDQGLATVEMEDWFDTLNRDFRYQLTVIGVFAQAIIKEKVTNNQFVIQTDLPNVEVSWQVTGIRQDPYANENRIEVEVEKSAEFKGQYLHPEAYNQPFEKGFDFIKLGRKTLEELESEGKKKVEKK